MSIFKFISPTKLKYIGRKHEVDDIYTFSFQPDTRLRWHAGQHGLVELRLPNGKTARRMFSLSSAPSEGIVSISTRWVGKAKGSDFKKALWNLKQGNTAVVRGPVGPLHVRDNSHQNIFIAYGLGVTPFRSIIVEAGLSDRSLHGMLLHGNHDPKNVLFKDEIEITTKKLPNFEMHYIFEPHRIDEKIINSINDKSKTTTFYLAGSPKIVKSIKRKLQNLGVSSSRIVKDPFLGHGLS